VILGGDGLGGLFWQPTVITGVTADAAMSREETFGPVAGIARFATETDGARGEQHALRPRAYYYTATWGASGWLARRSSTGSTASTPGSSRRRSSRSAA